MDMTGKTVLITGASRGIGAATARVFAAAGANVVLLARSSGEISALAGEIGTRALALTCDVSDPNDVQAAVAQAVSTFGTVDILISNAGVIDPISPISGSDLQGWGRAIDINVKGVYYGVHAVLPHMIARGGGSIFTIGSGAAHSPLEGWSHYCTSKAAVYMFNQCVDREYRGKGIRAISLSPGTVATEMQVKIKASGINPVSQLDPSVHIPADWPARCLLWMCGPEADAYLGDEISLRDDGIRRAVGLIT